MKTLYTSDLATVVLGDSTDPAVIDAAPVADLLCTDPPYGVRWQSGFRSEAFPEIIGDDGTLDVPAVLGAWCKRLQAHRHVYVFGYAPDQLAEPMRLGGTCTLVWDKQKHNGGNLSLPWGPGHEPIAFGVYTPSARRRAQGGGNLAARLRRSSVIRVRGLSGQVIRHPTEKPTALMRSLIESSTSPGDLVLDPFAGSGTTLVAAVLEGRRAYGVELDSRYAELAVDRVVAAEKIARQIAAA
ncbi:DNA-methyltransferase [Streptomonospora nanhaiensis]|uniref:DNA-methyltransferase n=1 Tax=Streptomonospora nanhaiensis TaxID=1323731 RepID=UPI001C393CD3|nr:DNA methyltransferase [Streptomonospora nanhaiensis]MBV2364276.1 site-specific DNA-methyltransferase [Streptomonospora nanhaiensis]